MGFKIFKNTVLFIVFAGISCGSQTNKESASDEKILDQVQTNTTIVVGANQTEAYLPILKGKRVGVVANQTSVIFKEAFFNEYNRFHWSQNKETYHSLPYLHLVDSLISLNINIKKVFSPEHGFRGKADAGELVKDGVDKKTELPILSLHGKHKKPIDAQLKDLDIVIFDIQDVGVRFYTYISTLHYVMEACAENNIPVLVLDRPNPNGNYINGPTLEKEHSSFLGMHTIPIVHGMTIGEYAQMINGEGWLKNEMQANLTVIPIKNYNREMTYSLPIRPSPNLPNDQSIVLYPSLGLFEGTTINAGRGTEFQFQRYGAPFLDKNKYEFNYTPVSNFGAKYPKHQNTVCYGVDLSNIKVERQFTLDYVIDAYNNSVDKSKFFNTENFTKHAGTKNLQKQIEAGKTSDEIKKTWKKDLEQFKTMRKPYLIYSDR